MQGARPLGVALCTSASLVTGKDTKSHDKDDKRMRKFLMSTTSLWTALWLWRLQTVER